MLAEEREAEEISKKLKAALEVLKWNKIEELVTGGRGTEGKRFFILGWIHAAQIEEVVSEETSCYSRYSCYFFFAGEYLLDYLAIQFWLPNLDYTGGLNVGFRPIADSYLVE